MRQEAAPLEDKMENIDAKTRETAVTLLDVLWTSKAAAGTSMATNSPPYAGTASAAAASSVAGFPSRAATDAGDVGTVPTKTTLRHGFNTKGWGNDTTAQHGIQPHKPTQLQAAPKLDQPEQDTKKIPHQQRRQLPSSPTFVDSSSPKVTPAIPVQKRENQLRRQAQEMSFEHREQELQTQMASQKFHQNYFSGANANVIPSKTIPSNATTPMTISMTSVGFGIDNNNTSCVDATEATVKAVKDAMERSTLRFHTFHSHSLQIKIKLGVPCIKAQTSPLISSDSKLSQSRRQMEPMKVNLSRLSSILPQVVPVLPVQIEPGGLFVPGETPSAPSICTVVACITLESQSQVLPSEPQSQPQTLSQKHVAPPLPPCPPLAHDGFTIPGFAHPKQSMAMASNATAAPTFNSREYNVVSGVVPADDNQQFQQHHDDAIDKKRKLQVGDHGTKDGRKSIEILAMISEREINRRNTLGENGTPIATTAPTPGTLSYIAPVNGNGNTSGGRGMVMIDSSTTLENARKKSGQLVTSGADRNVGSEVMTAGCTGNPSTRKSGSSRQPQIASGRETAKLVRSRAGGKTASYSDYSNELPLPEERDRWATSTRTTSTPVFPLKLHETLTQIEKDGLDDIIGWLPHGRSFKIHKQKEFTEIILPRYFVMTKKSSFLRQLNLYSFNRFSGGTTDKGSYYHEKFLRGRKFLSRRMTRQKVNGNRIRSAGNPDEEPDLSLYPICRDDDSNIKHPLALSSNPPASSVLTTSGAAGSVFVSSSTPSSQTTMVRAATSASEPPVGGVMSGRNPPVGTTPFLRVL